MIPLALLLACAEEEVAPPEIVRLSPREQLIRLSVELRGVHPGPAELAAIDEDPTLYADFVDRYLQDPRFPGRVREIFEERWRLRTGKIRFSPTEADVVAEDSVVADAIAEEPLRLVSWVVENDLPITEIVTADYTVADPLVAAIWDLDYPADGAGWEPSTWTDGRPAAGVLASSTLWQRYHSKGGNANRSRANAISRMLLCEDFLTRPIVLDRAAADAFVLDPEDAIATSATCQGCHVTLDPIASNLYGFYSDENPKNLRSETLYRVENEPGWLEITGVAPGWFGRPTNGLGELAIQIAEDPRFAQCMTRTVWEGLLQKSYEDADWSELQTYVDELRAADLTLRPVFRAVVLSDEFRAGEIRTAKGERLSTVRTVSPAQLSSIVADLTGYTFAERGRDMLVASDYNMGPLLGGVDADFATSRNYQPTVSAQLLLRELARAAAVNAVNHDLATTRTDAAYLLDQVTREDTPEASPDLFLAQMSALYERITGVALEADSEVPARLVQLWSDAFLVEGTTEGAWAAVVSALLRDPRVLFY